MRDDFRSGHEFGRWALSLMAGRGAACGSAVQSRFTRNWRKPWLASVAGEVERTVMVSTGPPTRLTSALVAVTDTLDVAA